MKLLVARAAQVDLARLHKFLADKNPAAARRAVSKIAAAIDSLAIFPRRGRRFGASESRDLIVPCVHRAEAGELVVLRVWHGREARD
jgi:toxin ParE1/3/4